MYPKNKFILAVIIIFQFQKLGALLIITVGFWLANGRRTLISCPVVCLRLSAGSHSTHLIRQRPGQSCTVLAEPRVCVLSSACLPPGSLCSLSGPVLEQNVGMVCQQFQELSTERTLS